jgi:PAS domain S-box-containing protein
MGRGQDGNGDARLEAMRERVAELERALASSEEEKAALSDRYEGLREEMLRCAWDLKERVKELNCLYGVAGIVERHDLDLREMLQLMLEIVPPAWQYPEIACARIVLRDAEYRGGDFVETRWRLSSDICVRGERTGAIEVFYVEERPDRDEGPFVVEERELLDALAERMARLVERKEMEEELKASEERYRLIFEFTGEAIYIYDPRFTLIGVNRKASEFIGYSEEELLGRNILELGILHPDDFERTMEDVRRLFEGEVVRDELHFIKKDGSVAIGDVTGAPLFDREGEMVAITNVARDITEQKKAEGDLKRINSELEAYAHVVSHDLRGPVSIVISAGDALQEMLMRPLREDNLRQVRSAVEIIRGSADAARRLIEDLLSLAKAGQHPEDASEVDVGDVIRRVLSERAATISEKKMAVTLDDDLGRVIAEPTHVYQLFSNLIANALAYDDNPYPRLAIHYRREERGVHHYTVWDNGPGIALGDEEKVFVPLYKGESGGTGVGLAIVKKVVDVYGGEIRIFNDGGARFEFTLCDGSAKQGFWTID